MHFSAKTGKKEFPPWVILWYGSIHFKSNEIFKKSNLKYHGFGNLSCFKFNAKWDSTSVRAVPQEHGPSFLLDLRWENISPMKTIPGISWTWFGDDFDLTAQCWCFCMEGSTGGNGDEVFKVSMRYMWMKRHRKFQRTEQKQWSQGCGLSWDFLHFTDFTLAILNKLAMVSWGRLTPDVEVLQ